MSASKKRQTMAKHARERAVKEKRALKAEKKRNAADLKLAEAHLASLPPEKLFALTCEDLRVLLGVKGKPTFQHCVFYPKAIPQYNIGHKQRVESLAAELARIPGLFVTGSFLHGVSIPACMEHGDNTATAVAEFLRSA